MLVADESVLVGLFSIFTGKECGRMCNVTGQKCSPCKCSRPLCVFLRSLKDAAAQVAGDARGARRVRLAQLLTGAPPASPQLTHLTAAVRRPLQFYRPDGFAVGYFETDASGFEEAGGRMESFDVNTVWVRACCSSLCFLTAV